MGVWDNKFPQPRGPEIGLDERESLMKLYVDTNGKQVTVTKDPTEKLEQNGRQKTERNTGRLMWSTQVFVLDDDGGEVITITTAGERPNVKVGQSLAVSKLEALPWATNGRNGVAFRAEEIKTAGLAVGQDRLTGNRPSWVSPGVPVHV